MAGKSAIGRFGSGRDVQRIEDAALLAGAGQFTDDVSLPGQAYLSFLRSPHPHARIVSIDTAAALAMPGVIAVLTGCGPRQGRGEAAAAGSHVQASGRLAGGHAPAACPGP